MLGSVRQHELTEVANQSNAQLQKEIGERQQAEAALRQAQAILSDRAKHLEELVAERTAELTATNKQLEAFVYSIAHDLRAPLRSMQGFSALLVGDAGTTLSETGRDFAVRIDKAAAIHGCLVERPARLSRISQQHVSLAPVNLAAVVESVLAHLQPQSMEKHARVESAGPWPACRRTNPPWRRCCST